MSPPDTPSPHFVDLIGQAVERHGHRPLLGATDTVAELSYAAGWVWADEAAQRLRQVGATAGTHLVVRAPKSVELLIAYLAALRLGAIWTPVAPEATAPELNHVIDDAEPRVVIDGHRAVRDLVGERHPATPPSAGIGVAWPELAPDRVAAMLYTSGTTGKPKGVPISGGALATNAQALVDAWQFTDQDVLVHALPTHHAHGLFVALGCSLASGASVRWIDGFDAGAVTCALDGATAFMGVPTHYVRLLDEPGFTPAACASLRLLTSGSAPLPAVTFERIAERSGIEVVERYGMTETLMLTSNPLDGPRKPGSVGLPLPGVDLRVASSDDSEVGMVEVRGPSVFQNYWGRSRAPSDYSQPDDPSQEAWFRTGDLGRFDADGYLHLVGRSKDLIISGGLNVYPAEVEAVLERHPGVVEVAVIGLPDDQWGQRVTAVVVLDDSVIDESAVGSAEPLLGELDAAAREQLSAYKVPKQVIVADALPRNTMGKIDKAALRRSSSNR